MGERTNTRFQNVVAYGTVAVMMVLSVSIAVMGLLGETA
jgi:hypothetical protein